MKDHSVINNGRNQTKIRIEINISTRLYNKSWFVRIS